ncbi:DUF481 domain-containing protein [Piscinibacter sakaiensis]|uniref:DUF481 domain-containing protein n=1 Tax=Piscinibacter sakaiensis TaxID=1547922 RepID=UPI003AAD5D22
MNKTNAARRVLRPALITIAALSTAAAVQAQDKLDGQWHGGVSIGGSAASGNTKSTALTVNADATRATDIDKVTLRGLANYGSSETRNGVKTTTARLFRLDGRYDYNLTQRVFVFGGGEVETNEPGGIDSRYNINGGAGYRIIRNDTTSFDVFGGIGYTSTDFVTGRTRSGAELLIGEESSHRISESTSFRQRLVYYPGTSEIGNRANFDAGLSTSIAGAWTLNTGVAVRYASKVDPGLKNTDTLLTVGFGYKY